MRTATVVGTITLGTRMARRPHDSSWKIQFVSFLTNWNSRLCLERLIATARERFAVQTDKLSDIKAQSDLSFRGIVVTTRSTLRGHSFYSFCEDGIAPVVILAILTALALCRARSLRWVVRAINKNSLKKSLQATVTRRAICAADIDHNYAIFLFFNNAEYIIWNF